MHLSLITGLPGPNGGLVVPKQPSPKPKWGGYRNTLTRNKPVYPHFEKPQDAHVIQPSIMRIS